MPIAPNPWNSLELAKLVIGMLTPLSVAGFGWFINRRLKRFELLQWSNQKLIEKRITIYDVVGPQLNQLFCFYMWVGNWKDISPPEVLRIKRELDQKMYVYGHLFEKHVYDAYREFMGTLFETFQGVGVDATIRSLMMSSDGDRTTHSSYEWVSGWDDKFTDPSRVASLGEVDARYTELIEAFTKSLGVHE